MPYPAFLHRPRPRRRLLVVEDDAIMARALRRSFEREGFEVVLANKASTAAGYVYEGQHFDAVLCDFCLAGAASGLHLHRALGEMAPELQKRFILHTSAQGIDVPPGVRVLPKPSTTAAIHAAVAEVMAIGKEPTR